MATKKKVFNVKVQEVYEKTYEVLAENEEEASELVSDLEVIMNTSHYKENSFEVVSIEKSKDSLESIKKDIKLQEKKMF